MIVCFTSIVPSFDALRIFYLLKYAEQVDRS
nr:MAG TPA_asm: hypothetical protein [Caudoviricetes sp.]